MYETRDSPSFHFPNHRKIINNLYMREKLIKDVGLRRQMKAVDLLYYIIQRIHRLEPLENY